MTERKAGTSRVFSLAVKHGRVFTGNIHVGIYVRFLTSALLQATLRDHTDTQRHAHGYVHKSRGPCATCSLGGIPILSPKEVFKENNLVCVQLKALKDQ